MIRTASTLLAIVICSSCSSSAPPPEPPTLEALPPAAPTASATPDSMIGLAPGTALEQPPQTAIAFNTAEPGESELQARPNLEFPPVIPHSIEDLAPITRAENGCLDCHDPEAAAYFDATAVPPSHRVDLRNAPEVQGQEVVGARWICTSCHIAQTETPPLVENTSRSSSGFGNGNSGTSMTL